MNVLVYASSASHQLSNALRSVLSPFYTVQSILPAALATQPWTASCALLVLLPADGPPAPFSLPRPAHEVIQNYISAGGHVLGVGFGVTFLPHQVRDRFGLWDARSGTAIVPECPQGVANLSLPSSILLQTGAILSGLRPASVPFVLTRAASNIDFIRGRWEEPVGDIAGIQVPVGSGSAAFWGISPCLDRIEDTENVLALLRYALTSLELSVPPETTSHESSDQLPAIPRSPLPQFLLHPRGKGYISETVLQRLGLPTTVESSGDPGPVVIKDRVDTFHIHKVATLELGARLVMEARASADSDAPRIIVVLPADTLPTCELTPRFDAKKYFAVLAEARGEHTSGVDNSSSSSWGVGEALFYGEAVTSTQTMLERYVTYPSPLAQIELWKQQT
jgi:biotin---protein ligase